MSHCGNVYGVKSIISPNVANGYVALPDKRPEFKLPTYGYTHSWGSGLHRSVIGRMTISKGKILKIESVGFAFADLFVRWVDNEIQVEKGTFVEFNSWSGDRIGRIKINGSSLILMGDDGRVVNPDMRPITEAPDAK
jgi:hypothetical protein